MPEETFDAPPTILQFADENEDAVAPASQKDAQERQAHLARVRERLVTEVPHDEAGINNARIASFLSKYGLRMRPYLGVDWNGQVKIEEILAEEEGFELTDDYLEARKAAHGSYLQDYNILYVRRTPESEKSLGVGFTEAAIVHEEAHAEIPTRDMLTYQTVAGTTHYESLRGGFAVDPHGWYFEEAFAGVIQDKYTVEELGLPDGFGDRTDPIRLDEFGIKLTVPARCMNLPWEIDEPSLAAYGMELLMAKDELLFPAMLNARKNVDGLREFARRVNKLDPGLYRFLQHKPKSGPAFLHGTKHIIDRLYGGDEAVALAVADAQLGIKR